MPDTARAHRAKSESMDEIFSNPSCSLVVSGGYMLGEQLFFTGPNETFANGDKVVHGQKGMVRGSATSKSHKLKGVKVLFPGNKQSVDCHLNAVRRRRATSAAPSPAPHTRDAAHALCVPVTASAAAPQPSLHEQPLAPQPTARVREGGWPRGGAAWPLRWQRQRVRRPSPSSLLLTAGGCVHR